MSASSSCELVAIVGVKCDPLADPGEADHVEQQHVGHHLVVDVGEQLRPQLGPLVAGRSRGLGDQLVDLRVGDARLPALAVRT